MWITLADGKAAEYYKSQLAPSENKQLIVLFLEKLREKSYAEKLSAVTSAGRLGLTAAFTWEDDLSLGWVFIDQIEDAKKPLIKMSYHLKFMRKAEAVRQCSFEEAIKYIDLYAIRLILEKYGEL